jgi:hypothetical protein
MKSFQGRHGVSCSAQNTVIKTAYLPKSSSAHVFEHAVGTIGLKFFYQQELFKSV